MSLQITVAVSLAGTGSCRHARSLSVCGFVVVRFDTRSHVAQAGLIFTM